MGYLTITSACGKTPEIKMFRIGDFYYIEITLKDSFNPRFTFFVDSPQDITNFKNNVLQAYEKFLKEEVAFTQIPIEQEDEENV